MLELAFIILAAIVGIYAVFLVIRFVLPIFQAIFASILNAVSFLATILLIIIIIQSAVWIGLYPLVKSHFGWVTFSMLQLVMFTIIVGVLALFLVIVFGKSSAFKQYGALAVVINTLTTIFIILSLYNLSKNSAANFPLPKLHFQEAVFTLSIYFTSINISTYLFYGIDKFRSWLFPKDKKLNHWGQKIAHRIEKIAPWIKMSRVPEWVLHWQSICGGSLGACLGQNLFSHKISKREFKLVYYTIVITQTVVIIAVFFLMKRI